MVPGPVSWVVSWGLMLLLGLAATLALMGCEAAEPVAAPSLATGAVEPTPKNEPPATIDAATQAYLDRLASLNEAQQRDTPPDAVDTTLDPFAGAEPLPPTRPVASPAPAPTNAQEIAWLNGEAAPIAPAASPTVDVLPLVMPAPEPPDASTLSRDELLAALLDQLKASDDPALERAVTAAALSLADPDRELDRRLLEPLKPMQREAVERLHDLFLAIHDRAADADRDRSGESAAGGGLATGAVATGGGGFDRKTIDAALAEAFGSMPVTIVHADLCRSVSGYGVYEPMTGHNFLAGQTNRAIVYVEVEDFATESVDNGRHEVRLTQELILYKEDDGLAVWRHEPTQIVDQSRNHRRDFYVVQMITLPARLSAGRYRLKVRITDAHGDSVDETTLRVNVVADAALVGQSSTP